MYGDLSLYLQVLLVLSHSNTEPEQCTEIEREERDQLEPSTLCDLFSVKINKD